MSYNAVNSLAELKDNKFYRVSDVQAILKEMNLPNSIFVIRDYENWKCRDYKCAVRSKTEVEMCPKCEGPVRPALIKSPRTMGGGVGPGHRRYTAEEIKLIVAIFSERV